MASSTNIKVVCRYALQDVFARGSTDHETINSTSFRPLNSLEMREGGEIVVSFAENMQTVQLKSAAIGQGPEKDGFVFDRVFPMGTQQIEVFDYGVKE